MPNDEGDEEEVLYDVQKLDNSDDKQGAVDLNSSIAPPTNANFMHRANANISSSRQAFPQQTQGNVHANEW